MDSINTSSAKRYTTRQQFYRPASPETGLPIPTPHGATLGNPVYIVEVEEPRIYFQPGTTLKIKCFAAKPQKPFTYDAAALEQSLKQKYKLN